MTENRFTLEGVSRNDFAKALDAEFGVGVLEDGEIDFLFHTLEARAGDGETVVAKAGTGEGVGFDLRVKNTYLHIDVQRALLLTAIGLLDFFKTRGLAVLLWGASGRDLRCFARLSPEDGSFCNFLTIEVKKNEAPLTAADISHATAGAPCQYDQIGCTHLKKGVCQITTETVATNLQTLANQRAIECDADGRAVKTR